MNWDYLITAACITGTSGGSSSSSSTDSDGSSSSSSTDDGSSSSSSTDDSSSSSSSSTASNVCFGCETSYSLDLTSVGRGVYVLSVPDGQTCLWTFQDGDGSVYSLFPSGSDWLVDVAAAVNPGQYTRPIVPNDCPTGSYTSGVVVT